MVRINLIRKTHSRVAGVPQIALSRNLLYVMLAGAALAIVSIVGWKVVPGMLARKPEPVVEKAPTSFMPSTYNKANIVEDVVREISVERTSGAGKSLLNLPYDQLSFLERVNYEVLFGRNVFTLLSRVVPSGIGLKRLEVDNFQTIYAVGLGTSRELVSSTFISLKKERLDLLPQPFSYITSNNGDGYRFVVTCKTRFGLDLTDPFQASDHLPVRDDLPLLTRKIISMGKDAGVSFKKGFRQVHAERVGAYRRFHYENSGATTYNEFVKFLLDLYEEKVPCAFKRIDIKAQSGTAVTVAVQVVITTRE